MIKIKNLLLCTVLALTALVSYSQETTSDIQGTITDGTNPLSGAVITAIHQPTGTKYVTTARKDGRFNLPNLKIGGPYSISVTHVGFKEQKTDGIYLVLGQEFKADFTLVAETKTLSEIVVTGSKQNSIFNNSRAGSQEIISRAQIERLPTINRSIQDFVKLEPSANGMNIGGRSNQYNNMTVDGANFNNSFGLSSTLGGQTNSQPISLEAIEQIQVNISPYDVTQGGFAGTGINTVTKSGSNTIKATAYTYLKNQDLQGYKVGNSTVTKTNFNYNIYGVSLGGPIIKNKLFFFVSAESVKQSAPATSVVPSDASHTPGGNVSQANADTLTALSNFLKSKFGYDPGPFRDYNFITQSQKITAKIDWTINARNILTVKYNYLKSFADQFASNSRPGSGQTTGGQPGTYSMPFFGSGYVINNNFNIFIAELNTRFSNKWSNKLQVGYTALRDFRSPHSSSSTFPLVDILNNGNIYTTFGYEMYTYNNTLNTDVFQFADFVRFYKGSHELTFGTQDYYRKYQNAFAPGYQGVYQFNSLTDFYNSVNNGTANAKSYYLQYSALPGGDFPWAYAGSTELGLFAQDKWRASKNFTLTYGLRVDYTIYKQEFTDNPYFDALQFKDGSYNIGKAPTNVPLISPRLGFNWDVTGDKSLQIRGGFGIFSGPPPFVWISNQASNNGIQFGSFTSAANTRAFNVDPNAYRPTAGASNTSYSVALVDRNFKYPTVFKTNLAADKRLPGDWILTLEATLSKDINAVYYSNINLKETNAFALTGVDNRLRYLTSVSNSNKYYYGTTLANPNIGNAILMKNTNKGYGFVSTVRIQKNTSKLSGGIAYTYALSMNTAEFGSTASSLWSAAAISNMDPNGANLGFAAFYQPHRVIGNLSYKIDYAKQHSTSVGLIAEVTTNGVGSYVYNGDMNGDGNNGNDLIYIPKNFSDINLVKVNSGGNGTGTTNVTDTRTPVEIWTQLNAFIESNPYLRKHRGQYAERNANIYPYYLKVDLNVTQDFTIKTGKDKHTLRVSADIVNVGNMLNKSWGMVKLPAVSNFLKYEGLTTGNQPSFSFPYLTGTTPYSKAFINSTGIASRWVMQIGVRYLFN